MLLMTDRSLIQVCSVHEVLFQIVKGALFRVNITRGAIYYIRPKLILNSNVAKSRSSITSV